MKKILFPTDFSANAENALEYVKLLFATSDNKFELIHAWEIPSSHSSMLMSIKDRIKKDVEAEMLEWKKKLEGKKSAIEVHTQNRLGDAVPYILHVAKIYNPDYIVMGTKGASGLKKYLLGSNASAIVQKAPCGVIMVPSKAIPKIPEKIVWASGFSRKEDFKTLTALADFASNFGAEIIVAQIFDSEKTALFKIDEINHLLHEKVNYKRISLKYLIGSNVLNGLQRIVEEELPDMLAVSSEKKKSFMEKIGEPNIAGKVALDIKIPLMVFPSH